MQFREITEEEAVQNLIENCRVDNCAKCGIPLKNKYRYPFGGYFYCRTHFELLAYKPNNNANTTKT